MQSARKNHCDKGRSHLYQKTNSLSLVDDLDGDREANALLEGASVALLEWSRFAPGGWSLGRERSDSETVRNRHEIAAGWKHEPILHHVPIKAAERSSGFCNMPFLRHCSEKRCERAAKKGLAILVQHEDTGNTNIEAVQKLKSAR